MLVDVVSERAVASKLMFSGIQSVFVLLRRGIFILPMQESAPLIGRGFAFWFLMH